MSLREIATTTAASAKDAERDRRRAAADKELAARTGYVVAGLAPLVTAEQVTVKERGRKIPLLRHKHGGVDHFGPAVDVWKMTEINATIFQADDLDVVVYRTSRGGRSELALTLLVTCSVCTVDTVPHEQLFGTADIKVWSDDDTYRRTEIAKKIGVILDMGHLCAFHLSAKVNARCQTCHRPYHDPAGMDADERHYALHDGWVGR